MANTMVGFPPPFQAQEWLEELRWNGGPSNMEYGWNEGRVWAKWFVQNPIQEQCQQLLSACSEGAEVNYENVMVRIEARVKRERHRHALRMLQSHDVELGAAAEQEYSGLDGKDHKVVLRHCRELHAKGVNSAIQRLDSYTTKDVVPKIGGYDDGLPGVFNFIRQYVSSLEHRSFESFQETSHLSSAVQSLAAGCHSYSTFLLGVKQYATAANELCKTAMLALASQTEPDGDLLDHLWKVNKYIGEKHERLESARLDVVQAHASFEFATSNLPMVTSEEYQADLKEKILCLPKQERLTVLANLRLGVAGDLFRRAKDWAEIQVGIPSFFTCQMWFDQNKFELSDPVLAKTRYFVFACGALGGLGECIAVLNKALENYRPKAELLQKRELRRKEWKEVNAFYLTLINESESSLPLLEEWMPE